MVPALTLYAPRPAHGQADSGAPMAARSGQPESYGVVVERGRETERLSCGGICVSLPDEVLWSLDTGRRLAIYKNTKTGGSESELLCV